MIAVDTNILVYAHRDDYSQHAAAAARLGEFAKGAWSIPWPCIHEFLSVVTRRQFLPAPTPLAVAVEQVTNLLATPTLQMLSETDEHWVVLRQLIEDGGIRGRLIHDAKIAAICLQHGVRELWTADRDFSRFPALKTVNPLLR